MPEDLTLHDVIFGTITRGPLERRFRARDRTIVVRLAPRLLAIEMEAQLVAAHAGRGIARVLSYQVAEDIAAGTLARVLQAFEPPPWVHMPPKIRAFLDHAAEQLGKLRVLHPEGQLRTGIEA